ncbi:MAG: helix-turn-helix transcriptional regulator [Clostridia bacterium]|nr:helix-turn-helix transcriptional regulator [Clostridia bacterium]
MSESLIADFKFSEAPLHAEQDQHKHNVYQMFYIVEGSMSCEIAGERIACAAPCLVFLGNYEPHIIRSTSERYVRYVLSLNPYQANRLIQPKALQSVFSFHPVGFSHVLDVSPIASSVRMRMEELYREWSLPRENQLPEGEALLLSSLLYQIRQFSPTHFTIKAFGAADIIVSSVRKELECNFSRRLDLDELASRHHVSRYYLTHCFKRVTGYSLKEYLMLCRISFACERLGDSTRTVGDIAEETGFHDMSNFARTFKKIVGMTPSEFRKITRQG